MKKLIIISLAALLAACTTTGNIDLSNRNSFGLKCSHNANSEPNWEGCMATAQQLCAPQQVGNIQQLPPVGSGAPDDSYFMTFSCH
ncbi:hypothetical protein F9B74_08455 [Pelistega sp. NLN82]|uniref:Lipoprotein n=1 Tax=Pelistega ratti TaxID=2652177 RepID=A0A6L9Y8Y7_9BURK|nr:hypothetical protein [Pelistega ratti]NEN76347.1 hypothetical protein [Pelistega ratti]